jgi:tetratricopeptide (TPR) repeat protein
VSTPLHAQPSRLSYRTRLLDYKSPVTLYLSPRGERTPEISSPALGGAQLTSSSQPYPLADMAAQSGELTQASLRAGVGWSCGRTSMLQELTNRLDAVSFRSQLARFPHFISSIAIAAGVPLILAMAGCGSAGDAGSAGTSLTIQRPADEKYFPSSEPYRLGAEEFNRGHYGLAEGYFREAAEKSEGDAAAWIGLAASYDRLRRFDLADRAYARAVTICGETAQILNNEGYSLMLRGDLAGARRKFLLASEREPDNPAIVNNIKLLDGSRAYAP